MKWSTMLRPRAAPTAPVTVAAGERGPAAAAEGLSALAAALVSVQLSRSISVDPLDRIGQVSGLAALDLRFVVLGLLVVGACLLAARHEWAWSLAGRCGCAAVAGLATGLVAGGILLALRGTDWPLFANAGDSGRLIAWADDLLAGRPIPADYPPAVIHLTARVAELTGDSTASALRSLQVAGTALFGPIAYVSWRLVLAPGWALAVTLVAALPLLEPYKPYTTVVLVALVPVLIAFLGVVRQAGGLGWWRVGAVGLGTGVLLGVLFCVYSGWFVWSAPGTLAAALAVFPWRTGRTAAARGLALLGLAAAGLVAVAAPHLAGLLAAAGRVKDSYFYFDTYVDPAYVAMWRNDLPGDTGPWPPPGELGGVGIFTLLLVVGLGAAVALGGRRTTVVTLGALLAGAWLLRLAIASQMYATQTVQLYPRTSAEILYCLLLLCVVAVRYFSAWARERLAGPGAQRGTGQRNGWPRAPRAAPTVGLLCAALLLALSIGSSTADRYLPRDDGSVGLLAYVAQMVRQPDGRCPDYSANRCGGTADEVLRRPR